MNFAGGVGRFFRRFLEKLLAREKEGPDPPPRIREEAELQVLRSRTWTPAQWADFAANLAEVSYRDGFLRGFEKGAELADAQPPRPRLGAVSAERRRNWSIWDGHPTTVEVMRRRGDPGDPLAGVDASHAQEFVEALERHKGTYRVERGIIQAPGHVASMRRVRPLEENDDE